MLERQCDYIKSKTDIVPEIAIILGSGLGGLAQKIENAVTIPYGEIEGMPTSTTALHSGNFIIGTLEGKNVIVMDGRVHLYEGYSASEVVTPIRIMRALGAETLIISNASGGINKALNTGDFMLISDHISCFVPSPLIGKNDDEIGERYPDMSKVYDKELHRIINETGNELGIAVKSGVYAQLTGPQFETPAEIKMLSALGADAVGMSTVIEAIAARHCGFKIAGISLIANLACGLLDKPLSEAEVKDTAEKKKAEFIQLITQAVRKL